MSAVEPWADDRDQIEHRPALTEAAGSRPSTSVTTTTTTTTRTTTTDGAMPTAGRVLAAVLFSIPGLAMIGAGTLSSAVTSWLIRAMPVPRDRAIALMAIAVGLTVWVVTMALLAPWQINSAVAVLAVVSLAVIGGKS